MQPVPSIPRSLFAAEPITSDLLDSVTWYQMTDSDDPLHRPELPPRPTQDRDCTLSRCCRFQVANPPTLPRLTFDDEDPEFSWSIPGTIRERAQLVETMFAEPEVRSYINHFLSAIQTRFKIEHKFYNIDRRCSHYDRHSEVHLRESVGLFLHWSDNLQLAKILNLFHFLEAALERAGPINAFHYLKPLTTRGVLGEFLQSADLERVADLVSTYVQNWGEVPHAGKNGQKLLMRSVQFLSCVIVNLQSPSEVYIAENMLRSQVAIVFKKSVRLDERKIYCAFGSSFWSIQDMVLFSSNCLYLLKSSITKIRTLHALAAEAPKWLL
ncbi:MAG: hypothetical protein LQ347_001035 [Umbilicaria vellea]|nr:MAG: hypothetical protein LQ347_001035 [Umbilicaria vellea]